MWVEGWGRGCGGDGGGGLKDGYKGTGASGVVGMGMTGRE